MLFLHSWEGFLGGHIRRVREARIASLRQTTESTPGYLAGEQPGPDPGLCNFGTQRSSYQASFLSPLPASDSGALISSPDSGPHLLGAPR